MNRVDQKGTAKNFAFFLHLTHVWEMNNKTQPDNWLAEKTKTHPMILIVVHSPIKTFQGVVN